MFSSVTEGSCVGADVRTFSTVISACAKGGDWNRCLQLLDHMQQWDLVPDLHCHTALLSSYQRNRAWQLGLEHLKQHFFHPTERVGFGLDAIGYDTSLSLCEGGAWQEAIFLFGRMQEQQLPPSIASLRSLVKTLQNSSELSELSEQPANRSKQHVETAVADVADASYDAKTTETHGTATNGDTSMWKRSRKDRMLQDLFARIQEFAISLLQEIEKRKLSNESVGSELQDLRKNVNKAGISASQFVHIVQALDLLSENGLGEELKENFQEVIMVPVLQILQKVATPSTSEEVSLDFLHEIHGLGVHFTHEVGDTEGWQKHRETWKTFPLFRLAFLSVFDSLISSLSGVERAGHGRQESGESGELGFHCADCCPRSLAQVEDSWRCISKAFVELVLLFGGSKDFGTLRTGQVMTTPITLFLSVFEHETFWKLAIWVWQYRPERLSFWAAKARSWRMAGLPVLKARRCAPFFPDTIDLNTLKEEPCWKWWNVLEKDMLLWTPREVFGSSRVTPPVCHVCLYSLSSVPCTQRFVWPWHSCHGLRRMQLCKKQKEMGNMDKMAWSVDFIKGRTAWEVEYSDFGRIPRSFFQQAVCSRQFEKYHWNLEPVRVRQGFLPSWFSMCSRYTEVVEELILKGIPTIKTRSDGPGLS